MSTDKARGTEHAADPPGARKIFEVALGRTLFTEVMQLANVEVAAGSEAEARWIARRLIAEGKEFDWWNFEEPQEDPGEVTIHGAVGLGDGGEEGGGGVGGTHNDDKPMDGREVLRERAEGRYKIEDAVRWGIFEGEGPATRAFVVPLKRPACRELTRLAAPEIDADAESDAHEAAQGKIPRGAGASDRQDLGHAPGDLSVGDGEAEEEV